MKNFVIVLKKKFFKIIIIFAIGLICRFVISLFESSIFIDITDYIFIILYSNIFIFYDHLFPFDNVFDNNSYKLHSTNIRKNCNSDNLLRNNIDIPCNNIDKFKRKILWIFVEKNKNKYKSYDEFKWYWNSNINLAKELKLQFQSDYKELKYKIWLQKETLLWFVNSSRRK